MLLLADALWGPGQAASGGREILARLAWALYRELDQARDFPVIRVRWLFLSITLTKEEVEPAMRWVLTRLVGPDPAHAS